MLEEVRELMVREQFTSSCQRAVSIFLKERKPRNLKKVAQMAEQYLVAHNKKLSTNSTVARQDVKDNKFAKSGSQKNIMRCFSCNGRRHRAIDCTSYASKLQNELNNRFR